jgi:uncharacterized RDD family membrane protein YckC
VGWVLANKLAARAPASQNVAVTSYAAIAPHAMAPSDSVATPPPVRSLSDTAMPQGRNKPILRVRAAGFPRRGAAALVDFLLVTLGCAAVAALTALVLGTPLPTAKEFGADFVMAGLLDRNPLVAGALGLLVGVSALYQVYLGGVVGQTLGKRLFGLRVISSQGRAPGPLVACIRFVAMALSLAIAGLGFLWCIFDRERRALHDHLSGTYVILDER